MNKSSTSGGSHEVDLKEVLAPEASSDKEPSSQELLSRDASPPGLATTPFKTCTLCGHVWSSRDALLGDPQVSVVGYQVCFEEPLKGLFMFSHLTCGTTFAVLARSFADLYGGPVYTESHYGDEDCLGLCDDREALEPCPNTCLYAGVRAALHAARSWPKRPLPSP